MVQWKLYLLLGNWFLRWCNLIQLTEGKKKKPKQLVYHINSFFSNN